MDTFLSMAGEASVRNVETGNGGPFGAVIVNNKTNKVVACSGNSVTSTNDPTAHAEVNAIRKACASLQTFDLSGHTLYSSCEPCPMCFGAIYWSHLDKVYYSNTKTDAKNIGFDDSFIYEELDKSPADRRVPFHCVPCDAAKLGFRVWSKSTDKVEY